MVARPHRKLNRALYNLYRLQRTKKGIRSQPVAVFGPYGRPLELSCYGTIIFALEDIGLFRALPYIEMLISASCQRKAMVRRVEVLWKRERRFGKPGEVDESFKGELKISIDNPEWYKQWRQRMFDTDWDHFDVRSRYSLALTTDLRS